jgi:hypothetical protein
MIEQQLAYTSITMGLGNYYHAHVGSDVAHSIQPHSIKTYDGFAILRQVKFIFRRLD